MLITEEVESLLILMHVLLEGKKYQKVVVIAEALESMGILHASMLRMYASALIALGKMQKALSVLQIYPIESLSKEEQQLLLLMKATALWHSKQKKHAFMVIRQFIMLRT